MANLRIDDQRRVAPGQAPGSFEAPRNDAGAIAGRQMQQMGQQVERAAGAAGQIFTQELERTNEIRVNDAINRAQRAAMEQQREFQQLRGEAALRVGESDQPLPDVVVPRFERSITEIADELNLTPVQRERYMQQASTLATRFQGAALDHFITQQDAYEEQVYTTGVAAAQEAIRLDPANPETVTANLQQIETLTRAENARLGRTAQAGEIAARENQGRALADVVKDLADENVDTAEAFFEANYERMTAAQRDEARDVLRPARELKTAEQVADMFGPRLGGAVAAPGGPANFDQSMTSIWASEGRALVADDNGAGRARFGITERSHPQAWADGDVSREEAAAIYKRDYWDAIGADDLPAGLAHMAFDTAVNMGANRARSLLARANGDVTRFAQLRRDEYRRIAAEDRDGSSRQYLSAWLERVDRVEQEALGQAPSTEERRPTMTVTQAVAAARAALPAGAPPSLVRATEAEVRRRYTEFDQQEAAAFEAAREEAYRHIEATKTMPPASVISRLKPGEINTIRSYFETVTAPPVVRTDPDLELALVSRPDLWQDLTPEEFIARYGSRLSAADRVSYVGSLVRANAQQRTAAADVRTVPADAFSRAWTSVLDVRGIDRTPEGRTADAERQNLAQLQQSMRGWIIEQQVVKGRQLTEEEIRGEVEGRIARLAWDRPRSILGGGGGTSFATSFQTMRPEDRRRHQEYLRARGRRDFTEADVYQSYLNERVMGR